MSGTEIGVLGYRGMKEYEIAFDGFKVRRRDCSAASRARAGAHADLQSARIQTAARAVGVAQAAIPGDRYANDRVQFGQKLMSFPASPTRSP
jgi:(2S)-methylsuccinyl-CoA dehydrogenase